MCCNTKVECVFEILFSQTDPTDSRIILYILMTNFIFKWRGNNIANLDSEKLQCWQTSWFSLCSRGVCPLSSSSPQPHDDYQEKHHQEWGLSFRTCKIGLEIWIQICNLALCKDVIWSLYSRLGDHSLYSHQPLRSVGKADFLRIKELCEESIRVLGESFLTSMHPEKKYHTKSFR